MSHKSTMLATIYIQQSLALAGRCRTSTRYRHLFSLSFHSPRWLDNGCWIEPRCWSVSMWRASMCTKRVPWRWWTLISAVLRGSRIFVFVMYVARQWKTARVVATTTTRSFCVRGGDESARSYRVVGTRTTRKGSFWGAIPGISIGFGCWCDALLVLRRRRSSFVIVGVAYRGRGARFLYIMYYIYTVVSWLLSLI